MKFTILGGSGFVGSHLARHLAAEGHDVVLPGREDTDFGGRDLGHVVYAIGLTGDFRSRPYDTVDAHVTKLVEVMRAATFQSWLYLSSTRVYGGLGPDGDASETSKVSVIPSSDSLYDLSKLLGEAVCLQSKNPAVRVARLSNVYGPGQSVATFLGSVVRDLAETGRVVISEDPKSSKDYIAVGDVAALIEKIALSGQERLYNVASGVRVRHEEIAARLAAAGHTGVSFAPGAAVRTFPLIATSRVRSEFGFVPRALLDDIASLLSA